MNNPGSVDSPVLPCEILDMEVVSDIIEDLDDIEVLAETKDDPEPDILVSCTVDDPGEPDLTITFSVTDNAPSGDQTHG
jgi:hypothetical protein